MDSIAGRRNIQAAALLIMKAVFGRFCNVLEVEAAEPAAFRERTGDPVLAVKSIASS